MNPRTVLARQETESIYPHFEDDEYLFRRVSPIYWDEDEESNPLGLEAIQLPDVSVNRSRFSHPEWTRLEEHGMDCESWAVLGFAFRDMPLEQFHFGISYRFRVVHAPEDFNYSHSELRAYRYDSTSKTDIHLQIPDHIPQDVQYKWRWRLFQQMHILIRQDQVVEHRTQRPVSHLLEPHPGIRIPQ